MNTTRTRRYALALVPLLAVASLGAANGSISASSDTTEPAEMRTMVIALPSGPPSISIANYLFGPEGPDYYAQQGIDADVQYVDGSATSVQLVASGEADFSMVNGTVATLAAAATDPNLRIVAVSPGNSYVFAVPEGSDIQDLADLDGKTLGVSALASSQFPLASAVLNEIGIDPESDVTWLPIGSGAQAAVAINNGDVDAYITYHGQYEQVEALVEGGMRSIPSGLDDFMGLSSVVTSAELWESDREGVIRVIRALIQSLLFSVENPEAAVSIHYATFPEQKPADLSDAEMNAQGAALVRSKFEDFTGLVDGLYLYAPDEEIARTVEFLKNNEFIPADLDVDQIFDLSGIQEANDFDAEAVMQDAANWPLPTD